MANQTFTIRPLTVDDVPLIAQISSDAFLNDRQTIMKGLGSDPFLMKEHTLQDLPQALKSPRKVILKAVNNENGDTMGYIQWGFWGFTPDEMPVVEGRTQPPAQDPPKPAPAPAPVTEEKEDDKTEVGVIQQLNNAQSADFKEWMDEVMPEGSQCLFIGGLQVAPQYQRQGVGSALLRFGTKICDERNVMAWVHSSESALPAYKKAGFQVIRSLDCDLDEFSPMPPPGEGPDAKWGHYTLRYMKYFPGGAKYDGEVEERFLPKRK